MWALEQEAISQRDDWQRIHLQEKVWHHRKTELQKKKFLLLVSGAKCFFCQELWSWDPVTDLWLGIFRVVNHPGVVPVLWLLGLWVRNGFGREEVPVVFQAASFHTLVVNLDLVCVVWSYNQCVQVSELIILWWVRRGRVRVRVRGGRREKGDIKVGGNVFDTVPIAVHILWTLNTNQIFLSLSHHTHITAWSPQSNFNPSWSIRRIYQATVLNVPAARITV